MCSCRWSAYESSTHRDTRAPRRNRSGAKEPRLLLMLLVLLFPHRTDLPSRELRPGLAGQDGRWIAAFDRRGVECGKDLFEQILVVTFISSGTEWRWKQKRFQGAISSTDRYGTIWGLGQCCPWPRVENARWHLIGLVEER